MPKTELDTIASSVTSEGKKKPFLITSHDHISPQNQKALSAIKDFFSKKKNTFPRHYGVIYGVCRYIAGIGPINLPNLNINVPEHEPFLYLCPSFNIGN